MLLLVTKIVNTAAGHTVNKYTTITMITPDTTHHYNLRDLIWTLNHIMDMRAWLEVASRGAQI